MSRAAATWAFPPFGSTAALNPSSTSSQNALSPVQLKRQKMERRRQLQSAFMMPLRCNSTTACTFSHWLPTSSNDCYSLFTPFLFTSCDAFSVLFLRRLFSKVIMVWSSWMNFFICNIALWVSALCQAGGHHGGHWNSDGEETSKLRTVRSYMGV